MVNSLTKYLDADNLPSINSDEMAGALYDAADDATTGSGSNVDYLSFSGKTGRYSLGRDKEDIDPAQLYLVEPQTFVSGWVCWKDSTRVDSLEGSVYEADKKAVAREDLVDHGPYREGTNEGWSQEIGFGAIGCDEQLSQVKFSSSSKSGRNSVGDLMKEIGRRSAAQEPNMPLITFDKTTFESQGNKNFKPVFDVETWVSRESAAAYMNGELSEDQLIAGDAPKKKRKARSRKKK